MAGYEERLLGKMNLNEQDKSEEKFVHQLGEARIERLPVPAPRGMRQRDHVNFVELTSNDTYVYRPLLEAKQEFRLARLEPAYDLTAPISCTLEHFSLDTQPPEYQALAYAWGDFVGYDHEITVDGMKFKVTSNLAYILRNLRHEYAARWLWIDAICIDMSNLEERSLQVQLMKLTFSQASSVVVWLGDSAPSFDTLQKIRGESETLGGSILKNPELLKLYASNFDRPWFTRVWALQEYVLGRVVRFMWGKQSVDAQDLVQGVYFVWKALHELEPTDILWQEDFANIRRALRGFLYFDFVKETCRNTLDDRAFADILVSAQELHAVDPRDKVYGLLSLAPSDLAEMLAPDYTLSAPDVYRKLAVAMNLVPRIEAIFELLDRKCLADALETPTPPWLPSWIDDFSLRVSDLLQADSKNENFYIEAVVTYLEIFAIDWTDRLSVLAPKIETESRLSPTEKAAYRGLLHKNAKILRYIILQVEPTERIETVAPVPLINLNLTPLNPVDDDFSDSGYSSASSSAQQTSLVADEIAAHLLSHDFLRRLLLSAARLENRNLILEEHLRPCIRYLGRELEPMANESEELLAARAIRRHAPFVVRAMVSRLRNADVVESLEVQRNRSSRIARLLDDMALRHRTRLHDVSDLSDELAVERIIEADGDNTVKPLVHSEESEHDLPMSALDKVKEFMTVESVFRPFLHMVSCIVYSSPLDLVEAEVEESLQRRFTTRESAVNFDVDWDIRAFITTEFADLEPKEAFDRFLKLLVISGTVKSCYATNINSYLKWRWPETSVILLNSLRACFDTVLGDELAPTPDKDETEDVGRYRLTFSNFQHRGLTVKAIGSILQIWETGQQLAWLITACRQSEPGHFSLSEALFFGNGLTSGQNTFQIVRLPLKEAKQQQEACWMPLFSGITIAHHYPIPPRRIETKGLELPFDLMITLVGPLYPMKYGGVLCFKTHARLLYPAEVSERGNLEVQWHYEEKLDVRAIPPWRELPIRKKWHGIEILDTKTLVEARTFLGYCRKVVVGLGTDNSIAIHKNILYSGLDDEHHAPGVGLPTNMTFGTGGLLPVTLAASVPIVRQKAQVLARDLDRDYMDVLEEAKERRVILYDTNGTERAWMVPLSCVLLHMVQTWSANRDLLTDRHPRVNSFTHSGAAAKEVLLQQWHYVARKTISHKLHKNKLVSDLVMEFWKNICEKQFTDLLSMTQADYNFELQTERLYGWEYMEIVEGKPSKRKQLSFKTNWGLFRQECIVLFAQNLGEVIQPAEDIHICSKWQPIRGKRQNLTATIECLTTLAYQHGGQRSTLTGYRLTNKGYWHYKPKELFLDCENCGQRNCMKKSQYLRATPPQDSQSLVPPSEGAVVFGRRLLEKIEPPPPPIALEKSRSSSERPNRFNLVARARNRVANQLERLASGSTTTDSQQGSEDPLVGSEGSDDSS